MIHSGQHRNVTKKIRSINGVKRVYFTTGRWDGVVHVNVSTLQELGKVAMRVAEAKGVRGSETLVGF